MRIEAEDQENERQLVESLTEGGPRVPVPGRYDAARPGRWIHPLIRIRRVADAGPAPKPYA